MHPNRTFIQSLIDIKKITAKEIENLNMVIMIENIFPFGINDWSRNGLLNLPLFMMRTILILDILIVLYCSDSIVNNIHKGW